MNEGFLTRIHVISFLFCLFALILISKLFIVQIINNKGYSEKAEHQYITKDDEMFDRGIIYFSKKDNSLIGAANTVSGFKITIKPKDIKNEEEVYQKISEIIPLKKEEFLLKALKKDDPYEEIATKINKENADKILGLGIDGVSVYREKWRAYPGNSLASHVIGFLAFTENDLTGQYGLERYYNDILSRKGGGLYINFFAEVFSNISSAIFNSNTREGDIVTTIDPSIQNYLEKKLLETKNKFSAESIGGVIINPQNGEIYAMASMPDFDLNNFKNNKNVKVFSNPLVESVFEFGSTIKTLTMAIGLDAGKVTAKTTYNDKGFMTFNGKQINNYDKKGRGVVSMQEVLNQSLNTGTAFIMQQVGKDVFKNYMLSFGFDEPTGIDLPNETSGLVSNLYSDRDLEFANASFGQGIAITPIEAVRAFSSLANDGKLITPHLVKEIRYKDGGSKKIDLSRNNVQILKPESTEEVSRMLVEVVDEALLGGSVKIDNYSVAAKTGTAQIANRETGGYYEDKYLHSFMGYFPAYDSKFLIFIYINDPKGEAYASHTLTNPFIDITKFLISYYDVAPDR